MPELGYNATFDPELGNPFDSSQLEGATVIKPQPGPQTRFLQCSTDIAIYGGAAGGGKSFALLMEPLYNVYNPAFRGVLFRRSYPEITFAGGLWDASQRIYRPIGAHPKAGDLKWGWDGGAEVLFRHMQYEDTKYHYQGGEIGYVGFDELTHFSRSQVFYMFSRLRGEGDTNAYLRGSTNPDANSWVKEFLAPWVDSHWTEGGPNRVAARSGEVRYFILDGDTQIWVPKGTPDALSMTFVEASVYDNQILLARNPRYLQWLKSLPLIEKQRLLYKNWNITEGGNMFRLEWFQYVDDYPRQIKRAVRFWDFASTEVKPGKDPDFTAGCLMVEDLLGIFWIVDFVVERTTPFGVEKLVKETTAKDRAIWGSKYSARQEEEGGSAGKFVTSTMSRDVYRGIDFEGIRSTGSKVERARPLSSAFQAGNVRMLRAHWNRLVEPMFTAFPNSDVHDDPIDAASGAHYELTKPSEETLYTPQVAAGYGWRGNISTNGRNSPTRDRMVSGAARH